MFSLHIFSRDNGHYISDMLIGDLPLVVSNEQTAQAICILLNNELEYSAWIFRYKPLNSDHSSGGA